MGPRPIAVFDSGVGGLSVLREIRRQLPAEPLVYAADSAHAPYGDKPSEFVQRRTVTVAEFLVELGAKALVVACNTATGVAVEALRTRFSLPIVAIEPAVKPAAALTRTGVVGVLGTTLTLSTDRFESLVRTHAANVEVLVQGCPGLVERIESGDLDGPETRRLVEAYVRPLVEGGADTIVLGCTHYAFVEPVIREVAGPAVSLLDPAAAVARELSRRLEAGGLLATGPSNATEQFWTSGSPDDVSPILRLLWKRDADVQSLPERFAHA